jgi:hypothetical protein
METKYGLEQTFVISEWRVMPDRKVVEETVFHKGSFWYFFVEGKKHDSEIAKSLREDPENQREFEYYSYHCLKKKYGFYEWIYESENTEDDCPYLKKLRNKKMIEDNEREERWEQWEKEQEELFEKKLLEEEKEKEDMWAKLANGEITKEEFLQWHSQKSSEEFEEQENNHFQSSRYYCY